MADYYVDPSTGSNGNSGAIGAPWATLTYAVSLSSGVTAGDNIYLRTGTYTEFVPVKVTGTAGAPITIQAYTGETATLEGVAGTQGIMIIQGVSYITIGEGLYVSYGHAKPGGVKKFPWIEVVGWASNPTSNIILENFNMERPGWDSGLETLAASTWDEFGILIDGATDCTVDGVWARGMSQAVALRNQCLNATVINCDLQYTVQSCITIGSSLGVERGVAILNNLIGYSAIEDGIQFTQDFTNRADDATDDMNVGTIVAYNQIFGCGENALDLKGTSNVLIHGNIIWGIAGSNNGWSPTSGSNRGSLATIARGANAYTRRVILRYNIIYDSPGATRVFPEWKVYNNTFVRNNRDYTGSDSTYAGADANFSGIRHLSAAGSIGVRNNIMVGHQDGDLAYYVGQNGSTIDTDYNLYGSKKWVDKSVGSPYTVYTTLTAWRARLAANTWPGGKDANSIALATHEAIQFVNVPAHPTATQSSYDFNLQDTSPAKRTGGHVTLTNGSGTASTTVTVDDTGWFCDGYGRSDVFDVERVYINGQELTVTDVDDTNNQLTVTPAATWADNTPVYLVGQGLTATATPDIGAGGYLSYSGGGGEPPPEPSVTGSGSASIVRVACATSTGDQTITLTTALPETPIAWRFTVIKATADGTADDGLAIGWGWVWDNNGSIVQGAIGVRSRHNVGTSDTSRRSINDGCVMLLDPTSSGIDGQASFVSGSTTDVVINWSNAPAAASFLVVEAFSGVEAYFGEFSAEVTVDAAATIPCGFEADWIEVVGNNKPIPDNSAKVRFSHGLCTVTSGTPTQQCLMWDSNDSVTTTVIAAYLSNAYVGGEILENSTVQSALHVENVTSTSFDIATKVGNFSDATHDFYVFALKHTDLAVYSGVVATPTSTGDTSYAVGFTAGYAYAIPTTLTAVNTGSTAGTGFSDGTWDSVNQYSQGVADQDAVTTSNTQTRSDDVFINVDFHTGSSAVVGTLAASGTDLVVSYTTVDASARYMILAAVAAPVVASITADFSADVVTGTAPLTVTFTDASTGDNTTVTEWAWDFGDGNTSTSQNPSNEYAAEGLYTVSITASDGTVSDNLTRTEYIEVTAAPPVEVTPAATGVKVLASATYTATPRSDVQASAQVG